MIHLQKVNSVEKLNCYHNSVHVNKDCKNKIQGMSSSLYHTAAVKCFAVDNSNHLGMLNTQDILLVQQIAYYLKMYKSRLDN